MFVLLLCVKYYIPERKSLGIFLKTPRIFKVLKTPQIFKVLKTPCIFKVLKTPRIFKGP